MLHIAGQQLRGDVDIAPRAQRRPEVEADWEHERLHAEFDRVRKAHHFCVLDAARAAIEVALLDHERHAERDRVGLGFAA